MICVLTVCLFADGADVLAIYAGMYYYLHKGSLTNVPEFLTASHLNILTLPFIYLFNNCQKIGPNMV